MYRIGELANTMNISKRTVDYYTQIGLLHPVRTDSNYRLYGEESMQILELVEHYKTLNKPLDEIKSLIDMMKSNQDLDNQKVEKHFEQIASIMEHLKEEIKGMDPILQNLNSEQKKMLVSRLSTQGLALAQTLLLLFG